MKEHRNMDGSIHDLLLDDMVKEDILHLSRKVKRDAVMIAGNPITLGRWNGNRHNFNVPITVNDIYYEFKFSYTCPKNEEEEGTLKYLGFDKDNK